MIKYGYGNITDTLIATAGLKTNCNAIILLDGKTARRITDIVASYALPVGSAATFFEGGRLLVIGTRFESFSTVIGPRSASAPDGIASSEIYLDARFADSYALTNMQPRFQYHSSKGINIPKGVDCSIILTHCYTDNIAPPDSDSVIGTLSVDGFAGGSDAVFKNIR